MILPWRKPAPTKRTVSTHVEYDLAELNVTPAMIEPSAFAVQMATNNTQLYLAYLNTGVFTRKQAYELFTMHLDASLNKGRSGA